MESINSDERLYNHLLTMLSVASGMAGVCATAIGLVGIIKKMNKVETMVDDLFAIGARLFVTITGMSFLGLRTRLNQKWSRHVIALDITFFLGLGVVVVASVLLTYTVI